MNLEKILDEILVKKDVEVLDEFLCEMYKENSDNGYDIVPLICKLITEDWHEEHEDLVSSLQDLKDERSIDAIKIALNMDFPYLRRWSNEDAFHRKCTWALADIGTEKAREVLKQLSNSDDSELSRRFIA